MLRQYYQKGADLLVFSQARLNKVARQLKERSVGPWSLKHRQNDLMHVLRRSVELAADSRRLGALK